VNSRERVLTAFAHAEPDRVPIDWNGEPQVSAGLRARLGIQTHEDLLRHLGVDLRHVSIPVRGSRAASRARLPEGGWEDIWGVRHRPHELHSGYVYYHPLAHLETQADLDAYLWPNPDDLDYEAWPAALDAVGDYARVGGWANRILWTGLEMVGMEKFLFMMVEQPDLVHSLLGRVTDYCYEVGSRGYPLVRGKLDAVFHGSDFGTQLDTIISLPMWREFVRPYFERMFRLARENGCRVYLHSDGAIRRLLPDLIEMGLDVLNPIQVGAAGMDPAGLKRDFGDKLTFHGAIDVQKTLPFGSVEDVRAEVRQRISEMGKGGGYVLSCSHSLLPDVPLDNILAMYDEAVRSGKYVG
jgi:uroporphyrinogen decarboxylase